MPMNRYARRCVPWAFAALLPIAACSSNPPPAPPAAVAPAPLSQADTDFMNQAALGGLAEVQMGQLAAQKATKPDIRQFAQQMVDQHTQVNQQLTQLAQSKNVTPPTTLDPAMQQNMTRLQRERGVAFDRDYVRQQIAGHQAQLALFQREASEGSDADVKAFAAQVAPTIQQHLDDARKLMPAAPAHAAPHARSHARTTTHH
jgi:putative membrane protein